VLTGTAAINGTGNALDNTLTGNSAANTLDGGPGADTMIGGRGADTYVVDDPGDRVVEASGAGTDTVRASVSYTLPACVENLVLTGSTPLDGTGNDLANRLTGNAAANVLDGRGGADTLEGGRGDDLYLFDRGWGQDTVVENDTTPGNRDTARFGASIAPLDLVLSRSSSDLILTVRSTQDSLKVKGWYKGSGTHVEVIEAAGGGYRLLDGQVDQLIQAMAAYSQSSGLSWAQAAQERPDEVQAILAAYWQPAGLS